MKPHAETGMRFLTAPSTTYQHLNSNMKRILKFEVSSGETKRCDDCPFCEDRDALGINCKKPKGISCDQYDLTTLEFIGEEEI